MSLSDILSNTSLAVCVTAVLFGIFALIRIFTDKEQRKLTLLLFSLPAIAYMVPFFTLFGWMTTEALSNFKVKQIVPPPANLEQVMTLIIVLQLVVLVLACVDTFLRQKQRIAIILFYITAGLTLITVATEFFYFLIHYPNYINVLSGNSYFILILVLLRLYKNSLPQKLQTWLPPVCFTLFVLYLIPKVPHFISSGFIHWPIMFCYFGAPVIFALLYYLPPLIAKRINVKAASSFV